MIFCTNLAGAEVAAARAELGIPVYDRLP